MSSDTYDHARCWLRDHPIQRLTLGEVDQFIILGLLWRLMLRLLKSLFSQ